MTDKKIFRVWVSRLWWPWPKLYHCDGIIWGAEGLSLACVMLELESGEKLIIDSTHRTFRYGREFREMMDKKEQAE